ncbi:MAG: hypothetical protein ACKPKO_24385 [Candidatus Fonsibacter sp.]
MTDLDSTKLNKQTTNRHTTGLKQENYPHQNHMGGGNQTTITFMRIGCFESFVLVVCSFRVLSF